MSGDSSPTTDELDRRLVAGHLTMIAGMSEVLDIEAGLRDLHALATHGEFVEEIRDLLNIQAGLQEIVPLHGETAGSMNRRIAPSKRSPADVNVRNEQGTDQ